MKKNFGNNIAYLFSLISLTLISLVILFSKQELPEQKISVQMATSTQTVIINFNGKLFYDCGIDDSVPCQYSCAPDGWCFFFPNNREPLTKEFLETYDN